MSCDFLTIANKGIKGLHPYQAGKPMDELERELGISDVVKLASNENPQGVSDKVKAAILKEVTELTRYPDSNGFHLKQALAEKLSVGADQVTLGNGSNDVLELLARTFVSQGDEVIFSEHAFIVYPITTQAIGGSAVKVAAKDWGHDLDAMAAAVTDKTRLIFIANPNNPTGTFLEADELYAFLGKVPEDVVVVLDEAYFEYVQAGKMGASIGWITEFPNLVVSRTFSKAYGLAGLRVGYCISNQQIADLVNRVRQPFNCNSIALVAALTVLQDEEYLARSVAQNNAGMADLMSFFQLKGVDTIPSMGNFISIDLKRDAGPVYEALLKEGVIVRPIAGYGMPNHLRVSIGSQQENQIFKQALTKVLGL